MAWWVWTLWGAGFGAPLVVALVLWVRALRARRLDDGPENHRRADNGLGALIDPRSKWYRRVPSHPWTWVVVALLVFFAFSLWLQYLIVYSGLVAQIVNDLKDADMPAQYLSQDAYNEGLLKSTGYAAITLGAYMLIFVLLDRWRPTTPSMKLMAFGWGACGATVASMYVNTWASNLIAAGASGKDMANNAAAVFVAPFVEEACKATILFLLVMAMRRRLCSVLQMIGLSGLAAAGFAFVENIIYYVRVYCEAALVVGPEANSYLQQMFMMRGVYTSFGHPLFTMMTAFGLICGLRQRSKLARVICPLTGYFVAALLHMCFNGLATFMQDYKMLAMIGVMLVVGVIGWLLGQFMAQKKVIAWRLDDYIRMGWLRDRDPAVYSAMKSRMKLSVAGYLRGWRIGKATTRLMSDVTELAYLRQGVATGIVDAGVVGREHELVVDARALRGVALDEPDGLRLMPRYRGPAAWHTFKAWVARRRTPRPAPVPQWAPPVAPQPWGVPVSR